MANNLPTPNADAKQHSDQLAQIIAERIQAEGPISFADYMQMALYHPGYGYYSAGSRKFGEAGDFVTAPEISPLFSKCIARQCAQVLDEMQGGDILEFGAGSGVMAKDILLALQQMNSLPSQYFILEVSADCREQQQQTLKALDEKLSQRVVWLDALPQNFSGIILANEVVDAMPVHKFSWDNGMQEFYVDVTNDELTWCLQKSENLELTSSEINFAEGYQSEINRMATAWVKSLAEILNSGVILLIDYGFPAHEYYHPDRSMGTIMCHFRHYAHTDPLIYPGIQDITAHVDFTALALAAVDSGLNVAGFTHQAAFLINCGLTDLLMTEDAYEQFALNQQVKKLTLPSEMGELFKVLALTKNVDFNLLGFTLMNQLERL